MKGVDVLLDAAHELGRLPGLRIVAHDIDEAVARDRRPLDRTVVEAVPAYAPADLDEVLSASDVLLLPSVMRESHSIVTREALLRGVPAITTDTIGPEEVVTDGVNGLVVPAADPHLLAAALREVLDEPRLRELTAGAQHPPPVRSLEDQVAGLEATYVDGLAAGPTRARRDLARGGSCSSSGSTALPCGTAPTSPPRRWLSSAWSPRSSTTEMPEPRPWPPQPTSSCCTGCRRPPRCSR
jgi:hypothetical protein